MIYKGENKTVLCKGDFHPAQLYKGDKKIAGYTVEEFSAEGSVTLENCYNDKLHNAQIIGNSIQDGTPTPDTPVEIQSVGELVPEGEYAGKYKIPVVARGKNLLDVKNVYPDFANDENGITISNSDFNSKLTVRMPVEWKESTQYTFSANYEITNADSNGFFVRVQYTDDTTISLWNSMGGSGVTGDKNGTCTVITEKGKTVKAMFFSYSTSGRKYNAKVTNMRLEEGITGTPYEPYVEPQTFNIYLDEPLGRMTYANRICADYIDFEKSIVARYTFMEIYNGTEAWEMWSSSVGTFSNRITTARTVRCSHYRTSGNIGSIDMSAVANYSARFHIADSRFSTVDEFKAFLAEQASLGTPVTAVFLSYDAYTNKNPIEEPITLPKLPTFKGTTIYEIDTQIPATISGKYKKLEE